MAGQLFYLSVLQYKLHQYHHFRKLILLYHSAHNPIGWGQKIAMGANATFRGTVDNILSKTYLQSVHEIVEALFSEDERTWQRAWNKKRSS